MGNTFFYKKVKEDVDKITWKDILSESFKKHSREERDLALASGTTLNSATESDMLSKWDKPFLWFSAFKTGFVMLAVIYVLFFGLLFVSGVVGDASLMMMMCIPPLFVPFILMIFIWELNIPKNISILECISWWIIGGTISLTVTIILDLICEQAGIDFNQKAYLAPLTEEPAKLITAIIIILYAGRTRKIYATTGLVIGACVGAGFGAFESLSYAFSVYIDENIFEVFNNQILRGWGALGGHTLFCAPYAAAIAYNMKNSKLSLDSFINREFILTFLFSSLMHFVWNGGIPLPFPTMAAYYIRSIAVIILLWIMLLWMTKKCLNQVVSMGRYSHNAYVRHHQRAYAGDSPAAHSPAAAATLVCTEGAFKGGTWQMPGGQKISIGRSSSNKIKIPGDAHGVSRIHCEIFPSGGGWSVRDMNSSYGTYVNGSKLEAGGAIRLADNDTIGLGKGQNVFKIRIN